MTRIINIMGNGGAGKSFTTLNLGIALKNRGKDVMIVDANIYSPDLGNYSELRPSVYLNEFLDGSKKLEEVITHHPSGIKAIHSMTEYEHSPKLHHLINQALLHLHGKSEIVLVDSFSHAPAFSSILKNSDETIFVTNDDFHSIIKSKDFIDYIESRGTPVIGIILNKKQKKTNNRHVESIIKKPILGAFPYDEKVIDSINHKQPLFLKEKNSEITKTLKNIANLLDLDQNAK